MTDAHAVDSMLARFNRYHGEILRTPEYAFKHLADYPFKPHYLEVDGMRMHYVDEGKGNARTIFLLHGHPCWSYLYRHMIPLLVQAGYHVIAPDLIGFGKSDKPASPEAHSFTSHVNWLQQFVRRLGIQQAAAYMEGWGGMIGLRVLARENRWLSRLILSNTSLPERNGLSGLLVPELMRLKVAWAGKPDILTLQTRLNYGNWAGYFRYDPVLEMGKALQVATTRRLSQPEMDAYGAPFPLAVYCAGPRKLPQLMASEHREVNADWEVLKRWRHPVLTVFSEQGAFLSGTGADRLLQRNFRGAHRQPHQRIQNASHFLPEDQPDLLVELIADWLSET